MKKTGVFIALWAGMAMCLLNSCASSPNTATSGISADTHIRVGTVDVEFLSHQTVRLTGSRIKERERTRANALLNKKAIDTYGMGAVIEDIVIRGSLSLVNSYLGGNFQKITATAEVYQRRRPTPPPPLPPPDLPVRPLTRDVLDLIEKSSYETRELQYFISSTVTLERGKGMQIDIELITGGQGIIKEINAHERIIIPRDTRGVLIPDPGPAIPGGPRTIKICFDDVDEHTLTFRENPSDRRYYLAFREDREYGEFTEYGSESYRVNFDGAVPYLYVKLEEHTDDTPRTRQLPGRYVNPARAAEPPRAAPPPAAIREPAPTAVQETVVPGRSPQPQSPAPAAVPPPPAEDEEEELDLDALLGL
jgi:hypothetical protein